MIFVNIVLILIYMYGLIFFYQQVESRKNKGSDGISNAYVQKKEHIIQKNCLTITKNHVNNVVR